MPVAGAVPAGMAKRLLARVIDAVAALVVGGGLVLGGLAGAWRAGAPLWTELVVTGAALVVAQGLVQWWLLAVRGYTLGRLFTGLRVLGTQTVRPVGLWRTALRELVVALAWAVPFGWLALLLSVSRDPTGRSRGWHDRAAGDMVVDVHVGLDPTTALGPVAVTERLQALLGDQDRRRHRGGPHRVLAELPRDDGSSPARPSPPLPLEVPMAENRRVVPPAPYEQVASSSYRGLDDEVERTRLRQARTKVAYAPTRAQSRPRATLLLWDNRVVVLEGTALVGRNPSPREGEALPFQVIAVVDRGRSVSKTHLAIGVDPDGVWLRDRNSTNGTVVTLEDGQQILCAPEQKVRVPVGASVAFGDYWLTVAG